MGLCLVTTVLPGCHQAQKPLPPALPIATVPSQEPLLADSAIRIVSQEQPETANFLPIATLPRSEQPVRSLQTEEPVSRDQIPASAAPRQIEPNPPQSPSATRLAGSHQSDYLWLVGVLERGPEVGTWTLRYASPAENDRFGGRLPLVAPYLINGYRPGQVLRVEGHVVVDILQTAYQVEQIEVLPQYGTAMASTATPGR